MFGSRKKRERRERYDRDEKENSLRLSEIGEAIDLKSATNDKPEKAESRRHKSRSKKSAK